MGGGGALVAIVRQCSTPVRVSTSPELELPVGENWEPFFLAEFHTTSTIPEWSISNACAKGLSPLQRHLNTAPHEIERI